MQISQIVKKWRGEEGKPAEAVTLPFSKVVHDILAHYEAERENLKKEFPVFISTLQDVQCKAPQEPQVKTVQATQTFPAQMKPEQKEKPAEEKEERVVKSKPSISEESRENGWTREREDFIRGLYDEEEEAHWRKEDEEVDDELPIRLDVSENEQEEEEEETEEGVKEEEEEEEEEEEDLFEEENEPVNLEKLLHSMKEEEDNSKGGRDPLKDKGPYRRNKRKRGNMDRRKRRKRNDWQDPKKNK